MRLYTNKGRAALAKKTAPKLKKNDGGKKAEKK